MILSRSYSVLGARGYYSVPRWQAVKKSVERMHVLVGVFLPHQAVMTFIDFSSIASALLLGHN
jgi:hypothetical protein